MARSGRSNNSESNGATLDIEATLWAAADRLGNNMDRKKLKKLLKLLGLNLGIAAANIITFSPVLIGLRLFGAGALETALGCAIISASGAGLYYGNYNIIIEPDIEIPPKEWTWEDYIEALNILPGLKTFEKAVDLLLDQIERLQKKNKTIRDILLQKFSVSEISYKKFDAVIADVEKIFKMNIRSIINKLKAFDEEDYNSIREKHEAGDISQQVMEEKIKVRNEYVTFVKAATEYNEQILLKLDKLLLEISDLNCLEPGQLEQMPGMIEIDNLLKQAVQYKN
jgi:hypothetical protein